MKMLYISLDNNTLPLGIKECCLKHIKYNVDYKITTLNSHSHIDYELHIVVKGKQNYEIDGANYNIMQNELLIIPPNVKHRCIGASDDMEKFSLILSSKVICKKNISHLKINDDIYNALMFILKEYENSPAKKSKLTENRVYELICLVFRLFGYKNVEEEIYDKNENHSDKLSLAKKFIANNIKHGISTDDVASYYYLSTRQLTRLFVEHEDLTLFEYIRQEKFRKICETLTSCDLSIKDISEMFSYNNEAYFTTSFKNYFGITPSVYREMYRR